MKLPWFQGALDHFAQFFLSPTFTESATEREVMAVDSENCNYQKNDLFRLLQLGSDRIQTDSDGRCETERAGTLRWTVTVPQRQLLVEPDGADHSGQGIARYIGRNGSVTICWWEMVSVGLRFFLGHRAGQCPHFSRMAHWIFQEWAILAHFFYSNVQQRAGLNEKRTKTKMKSNVPNKAINNPSRETLKWKEDSVYFENENQELT